MCQSASASPRDSVKNGFFWGFIARRIFSRHYKSGLEVHHFSTADPEDDAQDFRLVRILGHRGVKARAALLDRSEMKSGRERDRFHVIARLIGSPSSLLLRGIAACWPVAKLGTASGNFSPLRIGFAAIN